MTYAIIKNNSIEAVGEIRQLFPNVSFTSDGPDQQFLAENGVVEVIKDRAFNSASEKLDFCPPYIEDGKVYAVQVIALSAQELAEKEEAQKQRVRVDRNSKLAQCDWTQLADSSVDKAAWASYRQELRDVPQQQGFPWNITWPAMPL